MQTCHRSIAASKKFDFRIKEYQNMVLKKNQEPDWFDWTLSNSRKFP